MEVRRDQRTVVVRETLGDSLLRGASHGALDSDRCGSERDRHVQHSSQLDSREEVERRMVDVSVP